MDNQKYDALPPIYHRMVLAGGKKRYFTSIQDGRLCQLGGLAAVTRQSIALHRKEVSVPEDDVSLKRLTALLSDYRDQAVRP